MSAQAERKKQARKSAFVRRKTAHAAVDQGPACAALLATLSPHQGHCLAGYMPIHSEIDPRPVMAKMARHGPVCVPVIVEAGAPLTFREWTPTATMVQGAFGALIPENGADVTPEVLIVPMVAFGPGGYRLGYGGGFYDRTLEVLRSRARALAFGFAFSTQYDPKLPFEDIDQSLDAIVTEKGIWSDRDGIELAARGPQA